MMQSPRIRSVLFLAALAVPVAARAQVCNGLPFRSEGGVVGTYVSGDASDTPYHVRQYGGSIVQQLPFWTPFGTHHAIRLDGVGGTADWTGKLAPTDLVDSHFGGHQGSGGISYTMDILPQSVAGSYVICLSAGVQGVWWRVEDMQGRGLTAPFWLSFGVPLRVGAFGANPHASFGGYYRKVTGEAPVANVLTRGFRPFGDAGVGLMIGPLRVDGTVRHEFRTRSRGMVSFGFAM